MKPFICPFCHSENDRRKATYVCPECGATSMGRFFGGKKTKCSTVNCSGRFSMWRCSKCGNELSREVFDAPSLSIGAVGANCAGKTSYITVMLHELERASDLELEFHHQTQEIRDFQQYNNGFIYLMHKYPPATVWSDFPDPLIWSVRNKRLVNGRTPEKFSCVLHDYAGEVFEIPGANNGFHIDCINDYIRTSGAIMVLIDPLTLPGIRDGNEIDEGAKNRSLARRLSDDCSISLIKRIANCYGNECKYRKYGKIDIPIAIVLTKFDTVINHPAFDEKALIKRESTIIKDSRINLDEIRQLNNEIMIWLEQIGEKAIVDTVDELFGNYSFFGVSSFGEPPSPDRCLSEIRPHRVLDPILWLYKQAGFIR